MTPSNSAELERIWKQTADAMREEMASFEEELALGFAEMHDRLDGMLAERQAVVDRLNAAGAGRDDRYPPGCDV